MLVVAKNDTSIVIATNYSQLIGTMHSIAFIKRKNFSFKPDLNHLEISNMIQIINIGYVESCGIANPFVLS